MTCVIIPTYNHAGTVADVVRGACQYVPDIFVVDDGSTDDTLQRLQPLSASLGDRLHIISYTPNRGKGHALLTGFRAATEAGFRYAVTLDSDGQHYPDDIPNLLAALKEHPDAMIVGQRSFNQENMPSKNTFANRFSNFWFRLQTGCLLDDTQCGFRIYPLQKLRWLNLVTSRYEAELELLVFSAWHDVPLIPVPVKVFYPDESERISHFRPAKDFARISLLNTALCFGAVVYALPCKLYTQITRKNSRRLSGSKE